MDQRESLSKRTVELSLDDELLRRVEHLTHDLNGVVAKLLDNYVRHGAAGPTPASDEDMRRTVDYLGEVNARFGLLSDDFPSL